MIKYLPGLFAVCVLAASQAWCADDYYIGGIAALATLSADGGSVISTSASQVSAYKPANGPALKLCVGRYLKNYVAIQSNYIWNSNGLTLSSNSISPAGTSFYSETRTSSEDSVTGDVLVFFRDRESLLRPYLSVGTGFVHLESSQQQIEVLSGPAVLPPREFSANVAALRVAVGMDVKLPHGISIRYSFSETISPNPLADRLSPPAQGVLKNFQNLWGLLKSF